jgi:hypothetical protein
MQRTDKVGSRQGERGGVVTAIETGDDDQK